MGIFTKKHKDTAETNLDVSAISKSFYDQFMFSEKKLVSVANDAYSNVLKDTITNADSSFSIIEIDKLRNELLSLRLEIVGLYWLHKYGLESAIEQSIFTQKYLHNIDLDMLWDEMDSYNQAVAASVINQAGSSKKNEIYLARANLFDKYTDKYKINDDTDTPMLQAIARPINRNDSESAWKKDLTRYYMALTLWKNLTNNHIETKLNKSANQKLIFFIRGLYEGLDGEI